MGEIPELDTHNCVMPVGKHQGERLTRVPVGYLQWMVRTQHELVAWAKAELARRGTALPDVEVTAHAIDRASLHCLPIWERDSLEGEGLHSWLARIAKEALECGGREGRDRLLHKGMKLVVKRDGVWPVLVTVIPDQGGESR